MYNLGEWFLYGYWFCTRFCRYAFWHRGKSRSIINNSGTYKVFCRYLYGYYGRKYAGLRATNKRLTFHLPNFIGKFRVKNSQPFVVGLLNGFMPCGPLQSIQLVALATGNPFTGGLSMFAFSLGTVPLMLGLGV